MSYPYVLSFKKTITVQREEDALVMANPRMGVLRYKNPPAVLVKMADALGGSGGTEDSLLGIMADGQTPGGIAVFYHYLRQLDKNAFLCRSILSGADPIATLVPVSTFFRHEDIPVDATVRYRLSRFACCHMAEGEMTLESPLGLAKIILHDWRSSAAIHELASPRSVAEICGRVPGLAQDECAALFSMLRNMQAIAEADESNLLEEDKNLQLRQWEFHDLFFHTRSRLGRHNKPFGGTYRFKGSIEPLPAAKSVMRGEIIPLYAPDIEALKREDIPFTSVIEDRRSVREYDEQNPVTVKELGEFLYRAARIRGIREVDSKKGAYYESSSRPYPGGGAVYELEVYLTVSKCSGLERGLYHYDPLGHRLCRLAEWNDKTERLFDDACLSMGYAYDTPDMLITISARFQRLSWKYESMAYAVMLKDAGILYQTMYLVATAMGLAPCGIGGGDSDLFGQASGLDYYTEPSVGEFVLGREKSKT